MNRIRDQIVGRVAGDGTKLALLTLLARQPRRRFSSGALGCYLPLPQSDIDRLLRELVDDGFVECSTADGETSYCLTRHPEVRQAMLYLARLGADDRRNILHGGHGGFPDKRRNAPATVSGPLEASDEATWDEGSHTR